MNHFSQLLTEILEGTKRADFAETSGIDRPALSNICNGKLAPTHEKMERILSALPEKHALPLIIAYLKDEAEAIGLPMGIIPGQYKIEETGDTTPTLQVPECYAAFSLLIDEAARPDRPKFRQFIQNLADTILEARVKKAAATGKAIPYTINSGEPLLLAAENPAPYGAAKDQTLVGGVTGEKAAADKARATPETAPKPPRPSASRRTRPAAKS